ncbi:MAG: putative fkbp-type peptidyl-prolyl cis-trans isomerase (rotamase) protein [Polaromonas sp.]|nr:putative fkbp-type peptidyl-prolyl cis-trans isomerase (rotamase) protein [Polaromonas sp.]
MKITPQCAVALTWTLKDTLGDVLDELDEPVEFLLGGKDLLASIEEALVGHVAGDALELHLEPENAFGDYDENLVFLEPRSIFPVELEEGMTYDGAVMPAGATPAIPAAHIYTVTDLYPEHVVLDGNHPLSGIAIRLALKIESVREATEHEVGQGSLGTGFFKLESLTPGSNTLH